MMIYVGLDDTDTLDSPGTNQLAKSIVEEFADRFECVLILRHQLLDDPRVPYTSKNGSASVWLKPIGNYERDASEEMLCDVLFEEFRSGLKQRFVPGSDPGLCVAANVPEAITEFGLRCQRELMSQELPRRLAKEHGIRLEGLGGTEDGVIGALAAVGLAAGRNDGRIVKFGTWPDDLCGPHPVEAVLSRDVQLWDLEQHAPIENGTVDVGKHLRPNYRNGKAVLFARRSPGPVNGDEILSDWEAVRLP
jgi:hypothetical protein